MLNIKSGTREIGTFILDIFFPKKCLNCGRYGEIICLDCASRISFIKTAICPECGRISASGRYCKGRHRGFELTGLIVATHYNDGPIKEMIHHLKYSGFIELSDSLGELICQQIEKQFEKHDFVVVPVPLHSRRKNRRGFNQSELIARYVSKRLNLPGGDVLVRTIDTDPQAKLTRQKRLTNLNGAFSCIDQELIAGKKVLLIDDVATTGATLNECAKVLKSAGAREVWGAVVAKNI